MLLWNIIIVDNSRRVGGIKTEEFLKFFLYIFNLGPYEFMILDTILFDIFL